MFYLFTGGDRSQEWAIKAAMWAQQRQMQEHMVQQQNQQQQQPPPADANNPPLPDENAPPQPPPPELEANGPFMHSERLRKLHGSNNEGDSSSPWNDHHEQEMHRHEQHFGGNERQDNWRPVENLDYREQDGPINEGEFPGHPDAHYSDNQEYASNLMQYPEGQNFWDPSHTQQWNHGHNTSFPPHGMNFPQPVPFAPMQGVPAPMVPNFYPHGVPPDARPSISIPEQVIASQIPEVAMQETNKRKGLPQWLRDALNKKEKEKQKKSERERAKQPSSDVSDEEETVSKSNVEQNQPSIRNVEKGLSKVHGKSTLFELGNKHSGYSSDDESDRETSDEDHQIQAEEKQLSAEERAYEQMQKIKYWMMEALVAVTNDEILVYQVNCCIILVDLQL